MIDREPVENVPLWQVRFRRGLEYPDVTLAVCFVRSADGTMEREVSVVLKTSFIGEAVSLEGSHEVDCNMSVDSAFNEARAFAAQMCCQALLEVLMPRDAAVVEASADLPAKMQ